MAHQMGQAGKYDDKAEWLLRDTGAAVVVVIVMGGKRGNGFSVSADSSRPGATETALGGPPLPGMLRAMADMLEAGAAPSGAKATPH